MRWAAAWLATCVLAGCNPERPVPAAAPGPIVSGGRVLIARCRHTVRLPQNLVMASHPWQPPVPCEQHPQCVTGSSNVMALRVGPDALRVRAGNLVRDFQVAELAPHAGHAALTAVLAASNAVAVVALKDRLTVLDGRHDAELTFPTPALQVGETMTHALVLQDGYGVVVQGPGAAHRNVWFKRPANLSAEIQAQYLLVAEDGTLRGHLTRRGTGIWFVDDKAAGEWRVTSEWSPDLRVAVVGPRVIGFWETSALVMGEGEPWTLQRNPASLVLSNNMGLYLLDPWEGLRLVTRSGARAVLPLSPTHDLAGAALPPLMEREHFQAAATDDALLIIERFRSANCHAEDRVHLVTPTAAGVNIQTLALGDRVRMHPKFVLGAFRWMEGAPRYVTVDAQDSAVFDATQEP